MSESLEITRARYGRRPRHEPHGVAEFLKCELPPQAAGQISYYLGALSGAAARYDRYAEKRAECLNYTARKRRLVTAMRTSKHLADQLCALDVLSRDEVAQRLDITQLAGSLL